MTASYYYSNENDRIMSLDEVRECYLEGCMSRNNVDLTPLDTYVARLSRDLARTDDHYYAASLAARLDECKKLMKVENMTGRKNIVCSFV